MILRKETGVRRVQNHMNIGQEKDSISAILLPETPRRILSYLFLPIACPVLMLMMAFIILPSHWFLARSNIPYLVNMGYADSLHNRECQVLIFGDSSAMIDVSPKIITAQTGLSACNIAEYKSMANVTGTLLVDEYLANNPRPRYIVFMYTPDDLSAPNWKYASFESTTYYVQRRLNLTTAWELAVHPQNTLDWAGHGLRMVVLHFHTAPFAQEVYRLRADRDGLLPNPWPPVPNCVFPLQHTGPDPAWIEQLRRYQTDATTVFVDATPTSDCDRNLPLYQKTLVGMVDNLPYRSLPQDAFTNNLHASEQGIERISNLIAAQINDKMRSQATAVSVYAEP